MLLLTFEKQEQKNVMLEISKLSKYLLTYVLFSFN